MYLSAMLEILVDHQAPRPDSDTNTPAYSECLMMTPKSFAYIALHCTSKSKIIFFSKRE